MVLNNIRALRAAIVYCIPRITIMRDDALGDSGHFLIGDEVFESCCSMLRELKSALDSAPARNCDVGTAKEQAVRKAEYCLRYAPFEDSNCDACPLHNYNRAQPERMEGYSCDLAWGQLPYEAAQEGGKA